ncbi:MAG TPA: serpin family protein, partial [Candidatus Melainabacteria bacterium]|nr:serpin family protein [Candidatus Melainabacteria bacterium]
MRGRISKPSDTAKSTRKIAFRLMNAFCGSNANVCISPLSISIALQLLLSGASGNTLQEMIKALDIESSGRDGLAEDYKIAMARLHEEDNGSARVIFSVANLIVANQGVLLHPGFIEFLQRNYAAEAGSENFADPQTVLQINAWVSAKTFGRIP